MEEGDQTASTENLNGGIEGNEPNNGNEELWEENQGREDAEVEDWKVNDMSEFYCIDSDNLAYIVKDFKGSFSESVIQVNSSKKSKKKKKKKKKKPVGTSAYSNDVEESEERKRDTMFEKLTLCEGEEKTFHSSTLSASSLHWDKVNLNEKTSSGQSGHLAVTLQREESEGMMILGGKMADGLVRKCQIFDIHHASKPLRNVDIKGSFIPRNGATITVDHTGDRLVSKPLAKY